MDIFLSYASEDRDRIQPLVRALEGTGWTLFWDRTIPAGKTWRQVVGRELDSCRSMVVVWSRASVESDFVLEEADRGKRRGILVPVRIDDVDAPLGFGGIQAADLVGWEGASSAPPFQRFVRDLGMVLAEGQSAPGATSTVREPRRVRIFLSTASDVREECQQARELLSRLARDPCYAEGIAVDVVSWEIWNEVFPGGVSRQKVMSQGLPRPSECDIVISILWRRIGAPLPQTWRRPDGSTGLSGAEWEFWDAYTRRLHEHMHGKKGLRPRPSLFVYHRNQLPFVEGEGDAETPGETARQAQGVESFLREVEQKEWPLRVPVYHYRTLDEFGLHLEHSVRDCVDTLLKENREPSPS